MGFVSILILAAAILAQAQGAPADSGITLVIWSTTGTLVGLVVFYFITNNSRSSLHLFLLFFSYSDPGR
jgi:hypothetical protein